MEPGSWVTSWGRATLRAGLLTSAWARNRKRHFSLFCRCIFGDLCYSSKLTCTITNAILIKMFPELIFKILRPPTLTSAVPKTNQEYQKQKNLVCPNNTVGSSHPQVLPLWIQPVVGPVTDWTHGRRTWGYRASAETHSVQGSWASEDFGICRGSLNQYSTDTRGKLYIFTRLVIKIFFTVSFYILPILKWLTPTKYVIFLRFWANELMNWNVAWNSPFNSHQDSLKWVLFRVLLYK